MRSTFSASRSSKNMSLNWSPWISWNSLTTDSRGLGGVNVPPKPGVYEAKFVEEMDSLHIGQSDNLRRRVKQGMVRGNIPHSTGERIRAVEDVSRIVVRWAETARQVEVEAELHKEHIRRFGSLPRHDRRT
jgi:excinuclease UvrABC nuclease subunit